jgi:hypothetical protein
MSHQQLRGLQQRLCLHKGNTSSIPAHQGIDTQPAAPNSWRPAGGLVQAVGLGYTHISIITGVSDTADDDNEPVAQRNHMVQHLAMNPICSIPSSSPSNACAH